ncbi:MAG: hypothetical protein PVH48_10590 [Cyclobacteriaceae bacterium]
MYSRTTKDVTLLKPLYTTQIIVINTSSAKISHLNIRDVSSLYGSSEGRDLGFPGSILSIRKEVTIV